MFRTISLIVLALVTAAVVVPTASSGTPTASCSQADDPSGCYQGRPFIDPLAVSYLGGMGLTAAQIKDWTVGVCSTRTSPQCASPRSSRRRRPRRRSRRAAASSGATRPSARRRRSAPCSCSVVSARSSSCRDTGAGARSPAPEYPAAYLLSRRPENGPFQGSFPSMSEARPASTGSGCHNSDIRTRLPAGPQSSATVALADLFRRLETFANTMRDSPPNSAGKRSSTAITRRSGAPASGSPQTRI